jgi:mercuric ion binding protein
MRGTAMLRILTAGVVMLSAAVAWAGEREVTLTVENMTCATCPVAVRTAIKRVPGVIDVKVDLRTRTAVVLVDDSVATPAMVAEASRRAGFPARPKE